MSYLYFHVLIVLIHSVIELPVAWIVHHVAVLHRSQLVADDEPTNPRLNFDDHCKLVSCQP